MATPMHVYDEIAARYGKQSPSAVDRFFAVEVKDLDLVERRSILQELLARNAEIPRELAEEANLFVPAAEPPPPLLQENIEAVSRLDKSLRRSMTRRNAVNEAVKRNFKTRKTIIKPALLPGRPKGWRGGLIASVAEASGISSAAVRKVVTALEGRITITVKGVSESFAMPGFLKIDSARVAGRAARKTTYRAPAKEQIYAAKPTAAAKKASSAKPRGARKRVKEGAG